MLTWFGLCNLMLNGLFSGDEKEERRESGSGEEIGFWQRMTKTVASVAKTVASVAKTVALVAVDVAVAVVVAAAPVAVKLALLPLLYSGRGKY